MGGNIPNSDGVFRGLDTIYLFDPFTETWALQGRMREGRWYPTATQLPNNQVVITSGLKRDGSGDDQPDVEVFTPYPDPQGRHDHDRRREVQPLSAAERDAGRTDARRGPIAGDTGLLNPANWTWSSVPQLLGDHYYGAAVLLPDGPTGRAR